VGSFLNNGFGSDIESFPRNWEGTFRWYSGVSVQKMTIILDQVLLDSNNNIIATGDCTYNTEGNITQIDVKCCIDTSSLRFEMWEMNPVGSTNFVTDGSHVGTISKDFDEVSALWTTESTGSQGDLLLYSR